MPFGDRLSGRDGAAARRAGAEPVQPGRAGAGPAGLTADMIAGITMPLSRSIAWPAPSCSAALLSSPISPPPPVLAGIAASDGSPRIG